MKNNIKHTMDKFDKFNQSKNKFSLTLSLIVMIIYYIFIFCVGMFPEVLGYKIGPSSITLGIISGISIIIISIATTGIYAYVTNKHFDRKQNEILEEMQQCGIISDGKLTNPDYTKERK